jgi:hypothetical protein
LEAFARLGLNVAKPAGSRTNSTLKACIILLAMLMPVHTVFAMLMLKILSPGIRSFSLQNLKGTSFAMLVSPFYETPR